MDATIEFSQPTDERSRRQVVFWASVKHNNPEDCTKVTKEPCIVVLDADRWNSRASTVQTSGGSQGEVAFIRD